MTLVLAMLFCGAAPCIGLYRASGAGYMHASIVFTSSSSVREYMKLDLSIFHGQTHDAGFYDGQPEGSQRVGVDLATEIRAQLCGDRIIRRDADAVE